MAINQLLITAITLILAVTPLSLISIRLINNFFANHNRKLGHTTTICTNVTGTLTKNHLIVRTIFFDKYKTTIEDDGSLVTVENLEDKDSILIDRPALKKDQIIELMAIATTLCNYSKTKKFEEVMLNFFGSCTFSKGQIKRDYEIIERIPEEQEKKLSTIVTIKADSEEIFSFSKGNPNTILDHCTMIIHNNNKIELNAQSKRKVRKNIETLINNGQKVIAFAYKGLPKKRLEHYGESFAENGMTFIGMLGLTNPLNNEIKEEIEKAKQAGIKIYILSSEKERKTIAIGRLLRIINTNYYESITGSYLSQINDHKLKKMLDNKEKDYVFAELTPEDKTRIMSELTSENEVVAITNENHGFKEIIHGIEIGRLNNKNYGKFASHAISSKIAQTLILITALIIQASLPLTIALILMIDLIHNLSLEIALKSDKSSHGVMEKDFHPKKTKLFQGQNLANILFNSIITATLIIGIFIYNLARYGWTMGESLEISQAAYSNSLTLVFILFVIIQILQAFYLRNPNKSLFLTPLTKNVHLFLTAIINLLALYIITHFDFFSETLKLSPLSSLDLYIILFTVIIFIITNELRITKKRLPQD